MPRMDMDAFREIQTLQANREQAAYTAQSRAELDPPRADAMSTFWQELAARIDKEDDLGNMRIIVGELERDIDMLQALRQSVMGKDDAKYVAQLSIVMRLLELLIGLVEQFKRKERELADQALRYFLMMNPAIPSKVQEMIEREKENIRGAKAKKAGQKKARSAVDETKKAPEKTDKDAPQKNHARREKKMEA
ncbi:MAG: hypothetical protein VX223_13930 [Myxococcota bacterium]|nr:hypothetical protein [Myxococcota bacterium]